MGKINYEIRYIRIFLSYMFVLSCEHIAYTLFLVWIGMNIHYGCGHHSSLFFTTYVWKKLNEGKIKNIPDDSVINYGCVLFIITIILTQNEMKIGILHSAYKMFKLRTLRVT